jgi:hypothetical protein
MRIEFDMRAPHKSKWHWWGCVRVPFVRKQTPQWINAHERRSSGMRLKSYSLPLGLRNLRISFGPTGTEAGIQLGPLLVSHQSSDSPIPVAIIVASSMTFRILLYMQEAETAQSIN